MLPCSKDAWIPCCEGMSAVSLSVMLTEQWMSGTKSEVHPAAIHSCQQDFSTRTLLLHAGRVGVFCRVKTILLYYFNTVMLSLWQFMTVVSTIMTTTNKYIWKSHRCIQKGPKEVTLTLQNLDISCIFVFGVSFLQSRDPASNYQPSIRVH